jgi:hypothetical protein
VQSHPIHESDHFVDVGKLCPQSGSTRWRHPTHCQHRYQLRPLTLQGSELSLGGG